MIKQHFIYLDLNIDVTIMLQKSNIFSSILSDHTKDQWRTYWTTFFFFLSLLLLTFNKIINGIIACLDMCIWLRNHIQDKADIINPSMRSDEFTCVPCASYAIERQVYMQYAVLSSFDYNMNSFGDIVLILASFCRYWNGLDAQVKTCVPSLLLQLLCNINFC